MADMAEKALKDYFSLRHRTAVAFSGGADSSFLLHFAKRCGADVAAFYVKTEFQTERDLERALSFCRDLNVPLEVIGLNMLDVAAVAENGQDRCYHCKKAMFSAIGKAAGNRVLIDGTNASDPRDSRPGMRALEELGVESPLRIAGIGKDMVRSLSKEAGIATWNLPSDSCLATRIRPGTAITAADLSRAEQAESKLRGLGFIDFRVRITAEDTAHLQFSEGEQGKAESSADRIADVLRGGFSRIEIDIEPRK